MRESLSRPVGPGQPNLAADVNLVQRLLDRQASRTGILVAQTGRFDRATQSAVEAFQRRALHMPFADGVVASGNATFRELVTSPSQRLMAGAAGGLRLPPRTGDTKLNEEDYIAAAAALGCEVRTIKAVAKLEAPRGAYDAFGRPTLLFERLHFHNFTGGKHDRAAPDISGLFGAPYGLESVQYKRLQLAYSFDATAALKSASWGAFQILGENHAEAGFGTVNLFVTAMCQSIQQQLTAFVAFINFSPAKRRALAKKDWAGFAKLYNGPNYRKYSYDTKLQEAYDSATP